MKNSNDIIGNRTRDLPACSAVVLCYISVTEIPEQILRLLINAHVDSANVIWLNTQFTGFDFMLLHVSRWGVNCFLVGTSALYERSR
jgi:hypothetical protein